MAGLGAFRKDGFLNVIVESPRGSALKLKHDNASGRIELSRPLPLGLVYPCDWGIVPGTRGDDGDPLDAMVYWDGASYPGMALGCRVLGVLNVQQRNASTRRVERNDRFFVAPVSAPRQAGIESVLSLSPRIRSELELFFLHAVAFEDKALRILGWQGPDEALRAIRKQLVRRRR
jgi:inorganic pyrophosphatase